MFSFGSFKRKRDRRLSLACPISATKSNPQYDRDSDTFFYLTFQIIISLLDTDECSGAHAVKLNKCHPNASCINTKGSYNCLCNPTYTGNGFKCTGTFGFLEAM